MTDAQLFYPFKVVFEWLFTYVIHLGEHRFTFAELWIWEVLIVIIVWFLKFLLDD